jgi:hypothetical protein
MSAEYAVLDCARKEGAGDTAVGTDGVADLVLVFAEQPADISNAANSNIAIECLKNWFI